MQEAPKESVSLRNNLYKTWPTFQTNGKKINKKVNYKHKENIIKWEFYHGNKFCKAQESKLEISNHHYMQRNKS